MSELWNPYIYKSKGNQNLLYLNPQMQVLSEEKLGKAFLWMLISNKLFLDLEDKEAKKSRYVFYSVFNGLDKPILFDEDIRQAFVVELTQLIDEIRNPEIPFMPCAEDQPCAYCAFISLCGRQVKK